MLKPDLTYVLNFKILEFESVVGGMVRILHSLRNHHNPVHQLPPEIMGSIFESAYDGTTDYTADAFRFSHVCQKWRNTAISLPCLWSDILIDTRRSEVHAECYRRSSQAPLTVRIRIPKNPNPYSTITNTYLPPDAIVNSIKLLPAHSNRIRSMNIVAPLSVDPRLFREILDFETPNMLHLEFRVDDKFSGSFLTAGLFRGVFPRLTSVSISNTRGWFGNVRGLTTLRLHADRNHGEINAFDFVQTLQHSPLLRSLYVKSYIIRTSHNDPHPALPYLHFHALSDMTLIDTASEFFFTYLDIPNISHLVFEPSVPLVGQEIAALPRDLPLIQHLNSLSMKNISQCRTFRLSIDGASGSLYGLHFASEDDENDPLQSLSTIQFPLLTELTIEGDCGNVNLGSLYTNCPCLRVLQVYSCPSFSRVLHPLVAPSSGVTLCPELENIVLVLGSGYDGYEPPISWTHAAGRSVLLQYTVYGGGMEYKERIKQEWQELCRSNGIESFELGVVAGDE